jgi:DNA processing protein
MKPDLDLLLTTNRMMFLRSEEKRLVCDVLDSPEDLCRLTKEELERIIGRRLRIREWKPLVFLTGAETDLAWIEKRGIRWCYYEDALYPRFLKEIFDPPFLLFIRGERETEEMQDAFYCAVVGTRKPTGRGRQAAYSTGFETGKTSAVLVSGLALGIDGEAHRGCLDSGGTTAAVLGCGIDRIYPASHRSLGRSIIDHGGWIISEYPIGVPPLKQHFPARNRIISGLSCAVIVVEAPVSSGALITADFAVEENRDLYIHADGLTGPYAEGLQRLAAEGAPIVKDLSQLFAEYGIPQRHGLKEHRVLTDTAAGQGAGTRLARLMELELAGVCSVHNGVYYGRE